MKRQYRYDYNNWHSFNLQIYHDGKLINSQNVELYEIDDEINKLITNGYVYGYTKEEVEMAKQDYEMMLESMIE